MATLTITTTGAEDTRISAAFGADLGVGVNANLAQVKAAVVAFIRNKTLAYEQQQAAAAAIAGVTQIGPT